MVASTEPDAAEAAGPADEAGIATGGAVSGWLATTDAEGSDGSEAGAAGNGAEAALGTTTAVAAGVSGVCFVHADATAKAATA